MSAQKIIDDFLVEYLPKKVHHKGWSTHKEMLKTKALMLDTIPKVRIKKRSRAKGLSAREKRALGLYHIPKDNQK